MFLAWLFIVWIVLNLLALFLISERIDSAAQFADIQRFMVRDNIILTLLASIATFIYLPLTIITHIKHLTKK